MHKEVKSLAKKGFPITIVALTPNYKNNIKTISLEKSKDMGTWRFLRMLKHCFRAIGIVQNLSPKICHFHDPELIPWVILFLRPMGIKLIYDVHEDYEKQTLSKEYLPKILRPTIGKIISSIEISSCRFFEIVIAATPQIAKKFPKKKTFLVQNFP